MLKEEQAEGEGRKRWWDELEVYVRYLKRPISKQLNMSLWSLEKSSQLKIHFKKHQHISNDLDHPERKFKIIKREIRGIRLSSKELSSTWREGDWTKVTKASKSGKCRSLEANGISVFKTIIWSTLCNIFCHPKFEELQFVTLCFKIILLKIALLTWNHSFHKTQIYETDLRTDIFLVFFNSLSSPSEM
jgi:hypothetical protein